MTDRKCPGCHGIPESDNHDCLKSLTSRVSRHKCEFMQLVEAQKTTNQLLSQQLDHLHEGMQILKREKENEIKDLQYQLEELKISMSGLQTETKNMFLAKTTIEQAAEEANFNISRAKQAELIETGQQISEDPREDGEISSSQESKDSSATQLLSEDYEASQLSPETTKPAQVTKEPLEERIRIFRKQVGPMLNLGSQEIDLGKGRIRVKTKRVKLTPHEVGPSSEDPLVDLEEVKEPKEFTDASVQVTILPEEPKEEKQGNQFLITSNNLNTQGTAPSDQLKVAVEYQGRIKRIFIPKDMTTRQFRAKVRDLLQIRGDLHLHMVYITHRVIGDDDKTMWSMGLRHIANHIAVIPESIEKGDQTRLIFSSRGPNVNGDYVPQWGNNARRT